MKREKLDSQFAKYLDILKQIHINIPFTDALLQMPSYAKFLKEILSNKRKLDEVSVVMLTEKCSVILQNKLPQNLGDPDSFTISCTLGGVYFEKALCDSRASINLMPFSIFIKLNLGEMKDIGVYLQFADQSNKKPKGIIENMLVRVDKFVFPIDFIVLEMKEYPDEPIILGRPFLATDEFKDDQLIPGSMEICLAKSSTTQDDDPIIRREAEILEKDSEDEEIQPEQLQANSPALKEIESSNAGSSKKRDHKAFGSSVIYPISDSPWVSPVQVVPKKGGYDFYCFLDGYLGYNQIPIAPEDQDKTTFTCPHRIYAYRRMPFGLCNAPATFQRCMSRISSNRTEIFLEIFMDDFTLFGKTFEDCLHYMSLVLKSCDCLKAFETLKEKLSTALIVVSPDWNQTFEVMCDASDIAVGAVLGQRKDKNFRPIYYASRTMSEAQLNYAQQKKTKKDARPKLLRWILLLQEFDLEIKDKKGTENQVADHLSRLENPPLEFSEIKEEFPNEHIFSVNSTVTQPPLFADITNYLVGKWKPQDLSYQQRKKLISDAKCQRTANITKRDEMPLQSIQFNELEELRLVAYENARIVKEKTKIWHNNLIRQKSFQVGDQQNNGGDKFKVNGYRLKMYFGGHFEQNPSVTLID
ncbi:uncharacterized protein LOC142175985 [Nicotiana tabacum]|uniref:Uncharacterized protein LOC142175985 n=1 Tax=Nicotiana tabacum TaxID=4097 RepID=A0AC58TPI0_TOBAC